MNTKLSRCHSTISKGPSAQNFMVQKIISDQVQITTLKIFLPANLQIRQQSQEDESGSLNISSSKEGFRRVCISKLLHMAKYPAKNKQKHCELQLGHFAYLNQDFSDQQYKMSEVEQTLNRMQTHKNVQGIVIVSNEGAIIRSTYTNERKQEGNLLARLIPQLVTKGKNTIRDLDSHNQLKFMRLKTTKYEILIAPDNQFILIVVQGQKSEGKEEEEA